MATSSNNNAYALNTATIRYSIDTYFNLKRVNQSNIYIVGTCNGREYAETVQFSFKKIRDSIFMVWWYEYKTNRTVTCVHDIERMRSYVNIFDRASSTLYHLDGKIEAIDVSYGQQRQQ